MIEEVAENIYRIGVVLPNNPLKELNSYFIRGTERDILIDTGFRCGECRTALEAGLQQLHSKPERRDVLLTHIHSDHSGMADLFAGPERSIYMSEIDLDFQHRLSCENLDKKQLQWYISEGFPWGQAERIQEINPARALALPSITKNIRGLKDGDQITVGGYTLQALSVPGHTPGNMMFWAEKQGIMFSGDHILFDITPNITAWVHLEDTLGAYLDSLERVKNYPVKQTFPGHRKTGDYHQRIEELENHHHTRLEEVLKIVAEQPGQTAYEVTSAMTWQLRAPNWGEFPDVQKWFAVGEGIAHLNHLRLQGKIEKRMDGHVWRYYICRGST